MTTNTIPSTFAINGIQTINTPNVNQIGQPAPNNDSTLSQNIQYQLQHQQHMPILYAPQNYATPTNFNPFQTQSTNNVTPALQPTFFPAIQNTTGHLAQNYNATNIGQYHNTMIPAQQQQQQAQYNFVTPMQTIQQQQPFTGYVTNFGTYPTNNNTAIQNANLQHFTQNGVNTTYPNTLNNNIAQTTQQGYVGYFGANVGLQPTMTTFAQPVPYTNNQNVATFYNDTIGYNATNTVSTEGAKDVVYENDDSDSLENSAHSDFSVEDEDVVEECKLKRNGTKKNRKTKPKAFFETKLTRSDLGSNMFAPHSSTSSQTLFKKKGSIITDGDMVVLQKSSWTKFCEGLNDNVSEILNYTPFSSLEFKKLIENERLNASDIFKSVYYNDDGKPNDQDLADFSDWSDEACRLKSTIKPRMNTFICGEKAADDEEFKKNVEQCTKNAMLLYADITGLIDQLVTFRNVVAEKQLTHALTVSEKRKNISRSSMFGENSEEHKRTMETALESCVLPSDIVYRVLKLGSSTLTNGYGHLSFCDVLNFKMTCKYFEKDVMDVCFWDRFKENMILSCFNTQGKKAIVAKKTSNECGESLVIPHAHAYNNAMFEIFCKSIEKSKYPHRSKRYLMGENSKAKEVYLDKELNLNTEYDSEMEKWQSFFEGCSNNMGGVFLNDICKHLGFGVDASNIKLLDIFENEFERERKTENPDEYDTEYVMYVVDPKNEEYIINSPSNAVPNCLTFPIFCAMGTDSSFEREKSIMFGSTRLFPLVYTYDKNTSFDRERSPNATIDRGYPKFFMDPVFHAAPQIYCNACKSHVSGCLQFVAFWDETFEWCLKNDHPFGIIVLQLRTRITRPYSCATFKDRAFKELTNVFETLGQYILFAKTKNGLDFRTHLKSSLTYFKHATKEQPPQQGEETIFSDPRNRSQDMNRYFENVSTIIDNMDPDTIIENVLHDTLFDPMTHCFSFKRRLDTMVENVGSDYDFNTSFYDYLVLAYNHCFDICDFIVDIGAEYENAPKRSFSCGLTTDDFPKGDFSNPPDQKTMKKRGKKKSENKTTETIYEMATSLYSVYDMAESTNFDKYDKVPNDFHEKTFEHDQSICQRWHTCRKSFDKIVGSDFFTLRKCRSTRSTDYDRKISCRSTLPKVSNMCGSYPPTTSNWLIKSNAIIPTSVDFDNLDSELVVDPYAIWLNHRLNKYPNIKNKNDYLDPKNQKTAISYLKAVDKKYENKREEDIRRKNALKKEQKESKKRKREEDKKTKSQKKSKKQ